MKKIFLSLILFQALIVSSQTNMEDVVYLKNGSVIRGMILEIIPNQSVKIKSDRNIFVYKMDEIEKITKEESNEVSTPLAQEVYDIKLFKNYIGDRVRNETNGLLSIVSAEKVDGQSQKNRMDGSDGYKLFFNFTLKAEDNIYAWRCSNWQTMQFYDCPLFLIYVMDDIISNFSVLKECDGAKCIYIKKGTIIKYSGETLLTKTERNWKVNQISIKTGQYLAPNDIRSDFSYKKEQEEKIKIIEKKQNRYKIVFR